MRLRIAQQEGKQWMSATPVFTLARSSEADEIHKNLCKSAPTLDIKHTFLLIWRSYSALRIGHRTVTDAGESGQRHQRLAFPRTVSSAFKWSRDI
eukprot:6209741-Pleurochrysis_carterae.AAC.5